MKNRAENRKLRRQTGRRASIRTGRPDRNQYTKTRTQVKPHSLQDSTVRVKSSRDVPVRSVSGGRGRGGRHRTLPVCVRRSPSTQPSCVSAFGLLRIHWIPNVLCFCATFQLLSTGSASRVHFIRDSDTSSSHQISDTLNPPRVGTRHAQDSSTMPPFKCTEPPNPPTPPPQPSTTIRC